MYRVQYYASIGFLLRLQLKKWTTIVSVVHSVLLLILMFRPMSIYLFDIPCNSNHPCRDCLCGRSSHGLFVCLAVHFCSEFHQLEQRGAILATELKNNSAKLAKWTAQSILSGADQMKIG